MGRTIRINCACGEGTVSAYVTKERTGYQIEDVEVYCEFDCCSKETAKEHILEYLEGEADPRNR